MWMVIEKKKRAWGVKNTKKRLSLDFTNSSVGGEKPFFSKAEKARNSRQ
jgi:hypothetical protein